MARPGLLGALDSQDPALEHGAALDALPIVAYIANPGGVITYLSHGWERLTGNSASAVMDGGFERVVHPGDVARVTAAWMLACDAGTRYRDDMRIEFSDGSYRLLRSEAEPLRGLAGNIVGWFGTLTDIEDLRSDAQEANARVEFSERLLEASADGIKILDLAGRVLSTRATGHAALAAAESAASIGRHWCELWCGEDRQLASAAIDAARAGERGSFTGRFIVDAIATWWEVTVTPILGAGGLPERLLAVSRDVTEKLLVTRELAQSEERYRLLGEALPGTTWTATPDGLLDYISGQSADFHMIARRDALSELWLQSVHPAERARVSARWLESIEHGHPYEIQFPVQTADGAYRWQLVRALPQRDTSGAIVRWVGVNVDIDDQRRADEAREQFVRLVDASDDLIGIVDEKGKLTYINDAGRRVLGIDPLAAARGLRMMDFVAAEDRPFFKTEILQKIARDGSWMGEFAVRNFLTGEHVPMWHNAFSLSNESGQSIGLATVSRDLRERRRYEIGMRALAETGAAMYGSLDFEETVRNVADAVVRSFASFCVVDVLDAAGSLMTVDATHRAPGEARPSASAKPVHGRMPGQIVSRAIRGESTLLSMLPRDWFETADVPSLFAKTIEALDARSLVVVPIRSALENSVIGVLTCILDAGDSRGYYTAEDLRFAEEIAVRAGLAFYHARAYERERRIAVSLQEASLPRILPVFEDVRLSAAYRPGHSEATIGGDWYDAFVLDDGRLAITVGDILGSGLSAAVTMGKVRQAMRSAAALIATPGAMLDVADRTVRAESPDLYATALAGIYDPGARTFTFASAGHPGPVRRDPTARIEQFFSPGILLGLRTQGDTITLTLDVPAGSALVFFTDGLVEATRDLDEGLKRIRAAFARDETATADNAADALIEHVLRGEAATDDIAVLFAQFGPA